MSKAQFEGSRKSSLLPINGLFGENSGRSKQYADVNLSGIEHTRRCESSSFEPKLNGNMPWNILKTLDTLESLCRSFVLSNGELLFHGS